MNDYENDFDLSEYEADFDTAEVAERTSGEVPPGKYHVMIENAGFRKSNSGRVMFALQLRIFHPTQAGRVLFRNYMMDSQSQMPFFKADLATIGLSGMSLAELKARAGEAVGRTFEVAVSYKASTEPGKEPFQNIYINKQLATSAEEVAAILDAKRGGYAGAGAGTNGTSHPTDYDDIPF